GGEDDYGADLDYTQEVPDNEWPRGSGDSEGDPVDWAPEPAGGLVEHLLWQLQLSPASRREQAIAVAILDALDDDGYLRVDAAEIAATLRPTFTVDEDEIEAVRHRLQRFDPPGVASRDLRDCLRVQLELFDPDCTPGLAVARTLVESHLEQLP